MADIKFEIKETIGVLSESSKGWKKELNFISWNDKDPKYDIRDWSPDHSKMGKGATLTVEELKSLKGLLDGMDLNL
ncbi:YdbC family protein [Desulfitobacterium sp.]|uniref:YdbC family protein n=1 Tax=Desulfitobacterium sp. TaxID=49981 RepID=UPI002C03BF63|nr:YdbC family protein [Desulfitobacterium sp.]HVJ47912.1 YdbC family protein [Desulfitobacterium sp.]